MNLGRRKCHTVVNNAIWHKLLANRGRSAGSRAVFSLQVCAIAVGRVSIKAARLIFDLIKQGEQAKTPGAYAGMRRACRA
jgi:hypothetical protein